jgi:hypothetical protein
MQRGEAPLTDSRFIGNLSFEPEIGNRDWRQIDGLIVGESGDVGWGEKAAFNVDLHAGIDQEAHGSRAPLATLLPFQLVALASFSQVAATSSGSVR